ncbi:hypothetical protein EC179100_5514 [Escherichia coli 179100]|nr:hypothetical protein EC179100_5514 [Escherichia coli 179100]KDT07008.1 hypothetical protein AB54_5093 [Escherichia coli 2-011-08_S1_C3]
MLVQIYQKINFIIDLYDLYFKSDIIQIKIYSYCVYNN